MGNKKKLFFFEVTRKVKKSRRKNSKCPEKCVNKNAELRDFCQKVQKGCMDRGAQQRNKREKKCPRVTMKLNNILRSSLGRTSLRAKTVRKLLDKKAGSKRSRQNHDSVELPPLGSGRDERCTKRGIFRK